MGNVADIDFDLIEYTDGSDIVNLYCWKNYYMIEFRDDVIGGSLWCINKNTKKSEILCSKEYMPSISCNHNYMIFVDDYHINYIDKNLKFKYCDFGDLKWSNLEELTNFMNIMLCKKDKIC